mgnify:CR=1 FL=1
MEYVNVSSTVAKLVAVDTKSIKPIGTFEPTATFKTQKDFEKHVNKALDTVEKDITKLADDLLDNFEVNYKGKYLATNKDVIKKLSEKMLIAFNETFSIR